MPRHTARAIIIHDDALLLIERWRPGKHYFSIPGGGIEPGETPAETVIREVNEETGCQVKLVRQLYQLHLSPDQTQHHIFLCSYQSGEPHLPADSPEALEGPDNRFEPCWVPLKELAALPFLVWKPIQKQLVQDIEHGFSQSLITLTA